jgi:hypothetical protein
MAPLTSEQVALTVPVYWAPQSHVYVPSGTAPAGTVVAVPTLTTPVGRPVVGRVHGAASEQAMHILLSACTLKMTQLAAVIHMPMAACMVYS